MGKLLRGSKKWKVWVDPTSGHYVPERRYNPDLIPEESWGLCKVKRCDIVNYLANGYCVTHWDRGLDDRFTVVE